MSFMVLYVHRNLWFIRDGGGGGGGMLYVHRKRMAYWGRGENGIGNKS